MASDQNQQIDPNTGIPVEQGQYVDPNTGQLLDENGQPAMQQSQQFASAGSPESGPIPVKVEQGSEGSPEYGHEAIKRIEQQPTVETAPERNAPRPQAPQQKPQPKPQPKPEVEKPKAPQFFGYSVPPRITSNIGEIIKNKGKGDPKQARTWLYVFLDRLLKKGQEN